MLLDPRRFCFTVQRGAILCLGLDLRRRNV
jgi:hypothetical protein